MGKLFSIVTLESGSCWPMTFPAEGFPALEELSDYDVYNDYLSDCENGDSIHIYVTGYTCGGGAHVNADESELEELAANLDKSLAKGKVKQVGFSEYHLEKQYENDRYDERAYLDFEGNGEDDEDEYER